MSDNTMDVTDRLPPLEPGRSLVFVDRRRKRRGAVSAPADFVAQLIASESHLGEFRRARRRDSRGGASVYRASPIAPAPEFERNA